MLLDHQFVSTKEREFLDSCERRGIQPIQVVSNVTLQNISLRSAMYWEELWKDEVVEMMLF